MSERLEQTLRTIEIDVPQVDLWPAIASRLVPQRRSKRVSVAVAFLAVVVALFLLEPVRSTVGAWFGLGATTVTFDGSAPIGERSGLVGETITSEVAAAELDGDLPSSAALGDPDEWLRSGAQTVSGMWLPNAQLPEIGSSGAGAILSIQDEFTLKTLASGDGVEFVMVAGEQGLWLPGPHLLTTPDGVSESTGNVLIWLGADGRQYRLEVNLDRDAAIAIAEDIGTD